ncbi:hypothetical protein EJ913_03410 [Azospirillum doebereinerae]|uniref:Uncharacterized protein n=1 Tax=Azospirillum doebereinerae TaxID=92933 RepID=A0A3S0WP29_9PROT|nr:hypothetical protein EJ913_03410 [Azospirillum doebereinerae]
MDVLLVASLMEDQTSVPLPAGPVRNSQSVAACVSVPLVTVMAAVWKVSRLFWLVAPSAGLEPANAGASTLSYRVVKVETGDHSDTTPSPSLW